MTTPAGKTITYSFDAVGNRKFMVDPDGGRFTYSYDPADQIDHLVNPQNERTSYSYDAAGRRTLKKLANGTRASFSYDPADRLTSLYNLKSDSTVISSFEYGYDNAANRTHVVEANGDRVTWTYDDTYQLTAERRSGGNAYSQTFTYDSVGNRLVKNADGSRTTTVYDAANQIEYSVDASGRTTYTFDANGNQEIVVQPNGGRTTNAWDYENLNTKVELPSGTVATYTWNGDSHRVGKNVDGTQTKMVWEEENILLETDGADATEVVYTLEPAGYGNVVSERRKDGALWVPKYYHFDALGSTRNLTDPSETVTDTWLYDAWGKTVSHTGTWSGPFLWIGQVQYFHDGETGQYTIRFRIYQPGIARWISADSLLSSAGSPLYLYASNCPLNRVDVSGLLDVAYSGGRPAPRAVKEPGPCPWFRTRHLHLGKTTFRATKVDFQALESKGISRGKGGFIQKVTIDVAIALGESKGLDCQSINDGCCEDCYSLTFKWEFTETIPKWPNSEADNHGIRFDTFYAGLLQKTCAFKFNPCCTWSYRYRVTKVLTIYGPRRAGNRAYDISAQSDSKCCGRAVSDDEPNLPDKPMPRPAREVHSLKFPDPPIGDVWKSVATYALTHDRCGDARGKIEWTGYKRR